MNKAKKLGAMFCIFLLLSTTLIYGQTLVPRQETTDFTGPASQRADPLFGGNLGGFAYSDPYQQDVRRLTGAYSSPFDVALGEAILVIPSRQDPPQVRQSALEQQDLPVYVYLKGITAGSLLSSLTGDVESRDPLSGITNIPPIDYIDIQVNASSEDYEFVRFARHINPRPNRLSLDNLGMLAVYLRKLPNEEETPADNTITLDFNARIFLKLEESNLLGVSQQDLALKQFENEEEFFRNKNEHSFYSGKGYARATRISGDTTTLLIYNRDLRPVSAASGFLTTEATRQGLRQPVPITLRRGEVSQPLTFAYTGNPLTDMFRVRLDDVSTPSDKAELEFYLNGRTVRRKAAVGREIFSGSNWILKSITKTDSGRKADNTNIDAIAAEFSLNEQAKNRLISRVNQLGSLSIYQHTITLENKITRDRKSLSSEIISDSGGNQLKVDVVPIGRDYAESLEDEYCTEENPEIANGDFACDAIKSFKQIIKSFPASAEAEKAKRDLAEIYDLELIDFKSCRKKADGRPVDKKKCDEFRMDMTDLAHYYYTQIGEKDTFEARFGGKVGKMLLEDEGATLSLLRTIKQEEEQSTISIKIYKDPLRHDEVHNIKQLDEIIFPDTEINYKGSTDYVWKISLITGDSATLRLFRKSGDSYSATQEAPVTLKLDEIKSVTTLFPERDALGNPARPEETRNVVLTKVNTVEEAYITILPGPGRAFTTSTFKVHIPVDPRPFKLTPQQMESHIKTTEEIIEKLNSVIEKLDRVISTMKKLCLGVWAFLTLKNSVSGTRAIARQHVSESYKSRCQQESLENPDKFPTMTRCLNFYSDEITKDIDRTEKHIKDINLNIKGKAIEDINMLESDDEKKICGGFTEFSEAGAALGAKNQGIIKDYRDCLLYAKIQNDNAIGENYKNFIAGRLDELKTKQRVELYNKAKAFADADSSDLWDSNNATHIRRIISQLDSQRETGDAKIVDVEFKRQEPGLWFGDALVQDSSSPQGIKTITLRGLNEYDAIIQDNEFKDDIQAKEHICNEVLSNAKWENSRCSDENVQTRNRDDELDRKILDLKKKPAMNGPYHRFITNDYYETAHGFRAELTENECKRVNGKWKGILGSGLLAECEPQEYSTSYILDSAGRQINQFYSEDPLPAYYRDDGLTYCYPTGNGDYALVVERFQGQNKLINKITVFNVGPNGRIECGAGDDEIVHLSDKLDVLPELKRSYISKEPQARCTPKEDGKSVGRKINGKDVVCKTGLAGDRYNELLKPQCIDVMDPADCKIMFNFCDPVMCPSSRCTLGGRVPERDVIQSGIIGSTLLCLPNVKEGIAVPVCLTGISAGLKSIRSVLEGYKSCLEIKLNNNENVGFCDYIRSVGICEVVWKETYNLLNIGGRGLLDWVSGNVFGEAKGGGEYLTFQSSLDNVGKSARVFTEEYKTTYTAQFLSQSTEDIGTQICRLSVNGKLPNVGKILDQLTEPENPPQFTAFFDERPYAAPGEALPSPTIPAGTQEVSMYRVLYHIYAGTGFFQGAYSQPVSLFNPNTPLGDPQAITYSVFLRNQQLGLPIMYVTFSGELSQQIGRIDPGKFQQQTVQKPGPKGYNEICVVINGVEHCGFGKVGTSFGFDELQDALTAGEAAEEINSAEKCVPSSRTSREYSIAKLGAVAGTALTVGGTAAGIATSGIEKDLTSTGVVRVCSAESPTPETGRWRNVGSCGEDERGKNLGACWLDMESATIKDRKINEDLYREISERAGERFESIDKNTASEIFFALNKRRDAILQQLRSEIRDALSGRAPTSEPKKIVIRPPAPVTLGLRAENVYDVYLTDKDIERELSPYIYREVQEHEGIDYFFIKSIIKKESDWREDLVGACGEAGIIQLQPSTAEDAIKHGAPITKILNPIPGTSISFRGGCDREYGQALENFISGKSHEELVQLDERFDNEKAIKTAMIYFEKFIVNAYKKNEIPLTVENIAAGYNAGAGAVISGNIPERTKDKYMPNVRRDYDSLFNKAQQRIASAGAAGTTAAAGVEKDAECARAFGTEDYVAIVQDNTIACDANDRDLCCTRKELVPHIERIRETAANAKKVIVIVDPTRTPADQRLAFLDYLAGGVLACGPNSMSGPEKEGIARRIPNTGNTKEERIQTTLSNLDSATKAKINDGSEYLRCPHVMGRALDIKFAGMPSIYKELKDMTDSELMAVKQFREFMCDIGWANLGKEWWHYEITSSSYRTAKNSNSCHWGTLVGPEPDATPDYKYA